MKKGGFGIIWVLKRGLTFNFFIMKEAPRNITETATGEQKSSIPETGPNYQGGMTDEEATRVEQEFAARQAADKQAEENLKQNLETEMANTAKPEKEVYPPINFDYVLAKIKAIGEAEKAKKGWFGKTFGSSGDSDRVTDLKKGFYKIKNYPEFERGYQEALAGGGEDHAINEYLLAIGQGLARKSVDGKLVSTAGKTSRTGGGLMGHI